MTTTRRARACALPAAALAAALLLTPAAAHAAEGDIAAEDATALQAVVPQPVPSAEEAPSAAPTAAVPAPAPAPDQVAPDVEAGADAEAGSTFVTVLGAAHPGLPVTVFAEGFEPGDEVDVVVAVDGVVREGVDVISYSRRFLFDGDGVTSFEVVVPDDVVPGSVLTIRIADRSGVSAEIDLPVTAPLPVPLVSAPVGATAGVVAVRGTGALPGGIALVEVVDADLLGEEDGAFEGRSETLLGEGSDLVAGAAGTFSRVAAAEGSEAVDEGPILVDTEPVPFDEERGGASALAAVAGDGSFEARFVLPAGDYVTLAASSDAELTDISESSDLEAFSVAAAPVPAVVPAPAAPAAGVPAGVAPAASVSRPAATRPAMLAHTGDDVTPWALVAGGLLAAGGVLLTGRRLLRSRR